MAAPVSVAPGNFDANGSTVNGYQDSFNTGTLNSDWQFVNGNGSGTGPNPFTLVSTGANSGYLHVTTGQGDPNHLLYEPGGLSADTNWTVLALVQMNNNFTSGNDPQRGGVAVAVASNNQGIDELLRPAGLEGAANQHAALLWDNNAWGPNVVNQNNTPVMWTAGTKYWMELTTTAGTAGNIVATTKLWPADNSTPESSAGTQTWNTNYSNTNALGFAGLTASSNGGSLDMNVYYTLIENSQLPTITAAPPTGTLTSPGGVVPTTTTMSIASGGTWDLNGAGESIVALANGLNGGGSVINSNHGFVSVLTLSPTSTSNFSGTIAGGGTLGTISLVVSGSGTQVLSGSNSFTGGTTVNSGMLIGTSHSALGVNSGLTVAGSATFAYQPTTAGVLNLGSGTLTLADGSAIGTAVAGTVSQSEIKSTAAASVAGNNITVQIWGNPAVAPTSGTNTLIAAAGGLDQGTFTLGNVYNATNFMVDTLAATATAVTVNVTKVTNLAPHFVLARRFHRRQ